VEPWLLQTRDAVWSVREDAAVGLGLVCAALPDELLPAVLRHCEEGLRADLRQPAARGQHRHAEHSPASLHENRAMFSCCAPSPADQARMESLPWHVADGAVHLWRELSALPQQQGATDRLMPLVLGLAAQDHAQVCETIFKALPGVARAMDKRPFKRSLEQWLPLLVRHAQRRAHPLTAFAAASALDFLRSWLGEGIFKARVLECAAGEDMWRAVNSEECRAESFVRGAAARRVAFAAGVQ
jgi:hypothetical protein